MQTQVWPVLRYLEAMAPSTAASRSASSKTMKGALPPSSMETFLTVPAQAAISCLPTSVEPVKVSLRTRGLAVSSPPMAPEEPVMTLKTPLGMPARAGELGERQGRVGGGARRLDHHGTAGSKGGSGLAGDHRRREVPGGDGGADADRFLDDHDALVGLVGGNHVAVDAFALLGEPLDEGGGVADLAAGFGERLALLGGHQHGEVLLVLQHQVEPFAQQGGALLGGLGPPGGPGAGGGLDGAAGLRLPHLGNGAQGLARRGVGHSEGGAARRRRPTGQSM